MENIAVILAGGKGSRMKRHYNKVLEKICGKPLITYVIETLKTINIDNIFVVVGFDAENVKNTVGSEVSYVYQKEQLGTGDAFRLACNEFKSFTGNVLLLNGDGPILDSQILLDLCNLDNCDLKVLTSIYNNENKFGRIKRNKSGKIEKIIETKDCTEKELKINEINLGVYCFKNAILQQYVVNLSRNNAQNEYYVTDLVELFLKNKYSVDTLNIPENSYFLGVNTLEEVASLEEKMKLFINNKITQQGTRIIDLNNTYIDSSVQVGKDCVIFPNVHLSGQTYIGDNSIIEPNCYLKNTVVGENVIVGANSVLIDTQVNQNILPMTCIHKLYKEK